MYFGLSTQKHKGGLLFPLTRQASIDPLLIKSRNRPRIAECPP